MPVPGCFAKHVQLLVVVTLPMAYKHHARSVKACLGLSHVTSVLTSNVQLLVCVCSWLGSSRLFASDLVPYIRLMADRPESQHAHNLLPKTWCNVHNGTLSQHYPRRQYSGSAQVSLEGASAMAGLSLADAEVDDAIQESE